jgi:translation initiation factor IF-1
MAREGAFEVEGVIVETRPDGVCRAELANGHRLVAFLAGRARAKSAELRIGKRIWLEVSPCDLSKGRILADRL